MVDSSFYGDTPNFATDYPTQNDSNTNPVAGNTAAPSSFYPNGGVYEALADSDTVIAEMTALEAQAAADAAASAASATASAASAAAAAASAVLAGTSFLQKANNLSDLTNVATAKLNLSLVKADVGLGNVDNTSDVNKPVSTAQAAADALKANIASPTFTGTVTIPAGASISGFAPLATPTFTGTPAAPTAVVDTNTTQLATTAFVLAQASAAGDGTPAIDGTAARGTATHFARADHVHPTDTTRAALASPTFTGTPAAPTAAPGTNTTQLATTAYADAIGTLKANLASPTFTGTPAAPTATVGTNTTQIATTAFVLANSAASGVTSIAGNTGVFTLNEGLKNSTNKILIDPLYMRGFLSGLTLSTAGSSSTFGVSAGVANDSTNASLMLLSTAYTKTTGAWVVGSTNGALDTGAIAASTWYHAYLIKRLDTGVVDVLVSLSATAPTLPTNYTVFRRIGSMKTNGSSQWVSFVQLGDEFLWLVQVTDATAVASVNGSTPITLTVPTNVQVEAFGSFRADFVTAACAFYLSSLDTTAPTSGGAVTMFFSGSSVNPPAGLFMVRTNNSGQIRLTGNATGSTYNFTTQGWIDTRGKLS